MTLTVSFSAYGTRILETNNVSNEQYGRLLKKYATARR